MKSTQHETCTEYHWEQGDMVRLKTGRNEGRWDEVKAGEFGRVLKGRDTYFVDVSMHGFSRGPDSIGAFCSVSSYDLEPWVRAPEDEAAIAANVEHLVGRLAWRTDARGRVDAEGRVSVEGRSVGGVGPDSPIPTNMLVLADALRYLGDGTGSVDRIEAVDWTVNEAGNALLDAAGRRATVGLAGGGTAFRMEWDRRGRFLCKDICTEREHVFEGAEARRLLAANRREVGWIHDGRMPMIMRDSLDYPRTLRNGGGAVVVELDAGSVEVRRGEEAFHAEGEEAKLVRRACQRVSRMDRWLDARPGLLSPAHAAPSI